MVVFTRSSKRGGKRPPPRVRTAQSLADRKKRLARKRSVAKAAKKRDNRRYCKPTLVRTDSVAFIAMRGEVLAYMQRACRRTVQATWVAHVVNTSAHAIISRHAQTSRICGVALFSIPRDWEMHLELVCADGGVGGVLMKRGEQLAKKLGAEVISLDALPGVVTWYRNTHGYRHVAALNMRRGKTREKKTGDDVKGYRMSKLVV